MTPAPDPSNSCSRPRRRWKTARAPGQMTAVMRAMSFSAALGPKVLRIGVVRAGRIVEERVMKERITVTVGAAETATFVIASLAAHAKPCFKLFERSGTTTGSSPYQA